MGKSETGAQNQTAASAENSGAGPQTAGRNLTVSLLLFHFFVEVNYIKSVLLFFFICRFIPDLLAWLRLDRCLKERARPTAPP